MGLKKAPRYRVGHCRAVTHAGLSINTHPDIAKPFQKSFLYKPIFLSDNCITIIQVPI
jgi:hypothetical protein